MFVMLESCNAGGMFSRREEFERVLEADDELELEELELEDEVESVDDIDADLRLKFGSLTLSSESKSLSSLLSALLRSSVLDIPEILIIIVIKYT